MKRVSEISLFENWTDLGGRQPAGLPVEVGDWFPQLVLPVVETGEPLGIADLRGRPLLLHIFASW